MRIVIIKRPDTFECFAYNEQEIIAHGSNPNKNIAVSEMRDFLFKEYGELNPMEESCE